MIIKDQKELEKACAAYAKHEFITIDTEFLREKTYYPKLCLIQIGDPDKNAVAIDPLMDNIDLAPLFDLLENERVLKVFHAARQDLEIFYHLTGKVVAPFYDTQIAAMVCGYGDSVGYESLVRNITDNTLDKSSQFTDWSRRPLTEKQLRYALADVTHLVDIYLHLSAELERRGRTSWLMQEEEVLSDIATYENKPEDTWERIKIRSPKPINLSVLREIAAWRERKAQQNDIPRNWVMRDETLADMASQMPGSPEKLSKIRNISAEIAKGKQGKELIECIKKGQAVPPKEMPKPQKKKPLPPQAAATVDVLKMLLKTQCAEHDVAPKLLASQKDLEAIAVNDQADVPALRGWRHEVFGQHALALKKGQLAIGLKGSKIAKFSVDKNSDLYG